MIKKLALLLCLGIAAHAPLSAASDATNRRKVFQACAAVAGAVGVTCLIAAFPESVGEFFGAILRGIADSRYCSYCDRWYHKHHHHCHGHCHHHYHGGVTVTIY